MFGINRLLLFAFVILSLGIAWKLYKRYLGTNKLILGNIEFKPQQNLSTIAGIIDAINNGIKVSGSISINNFSDKDYTLNQIKVDCYIPKTNTLIAEQTNILKSDIVLKSKNSTLIPIDYNIDVANSLSLLKETSVLPQDITAWQIISKPKSSLESIKLSNLAIHLKGFIQADGYTLDINEIHFPYAK